MNFWHLQLHDNRLDIDTVKRLLDEKAIIGLGSYWKNKNGIDADDPRAFEFDMKIGDIVMIRYGKKPIALVEVLGNAYVTNHVKHDFDWFDLRRNVDVIDYFTDSIESILSRSLEKFGSNYIQAPGTLTLCSGENATNEFIKSWFKTKKIQYIMSQFSISPESKDQLKRLFEKFAIGYDITSKESLDSKTKELLDEFNVYLDKIKNDTFTLDDYTNRLANATGLPGSYLCNFLERRTKDIFGSSKPAGSALSFGIKADRGENSFTINKIDPNNHNKNNRTQAESEFVKYKDFFKSVVTEGDIQAQMELIESNNFISAKQILRKFLVLLHPLKFIYTYNDKLDVLYQSFFGDGENLTKIEKSYYLNLAIKEILNLEESLVNQIIISRFLWELANSQSITSKTNPNVILYGPPGTGKTYHVLQSLDFLTKGDQSKIRYVVFHPSFGYEDFIEGIKPCGVSENGSIKFELINGAFKDFCITAKNDLKNDYYFVVDEINRANLSAVFGETLVCLERSYRDKPGDDWQNRKLFSTQYSSYVKTLNKEEKEKLAYEISDEGDVLFGVPENLYFIGMMNNVDKSIDSFDLALRRRFRWQYMACNYDVLDDIRNAKGDEYENIEEYKAACEKLNTFISDSKHLALGKSFEFGHSLFMQISNLEKSKNIKEKNMDLLFNDFLKPTLVEYLRSYYEESELENQITEALKYFKL